MNVRLSYVVPVHNEQKLLERNLERLARRLSGLRGARIVAVENGSTDRSWEILSSLPERLADVPLSVFREKPAGLGYAYDRGLVELERDDGTGSGSSESQPHWVVLAAADLPFGFSDLDAALPVLASPAPPSLILGSKAHPGSRVDRAVSRSTASIAYRRLRSTVLGMRVGDCQGSLFVEASVAFRLRPAIRSRDFFYTTELVFLVERAGLRWVEVPVLLEPQQRRSTVRLFRDGVALGAQVFDLRRRYGRLPPLR